MKEMKASQNNNSCDSDVFYNHIELKNSQINGFGKQNDANII